MWAPILVLRQKSPTSNRKVWTLVPYTLFPRASSLHPTCSSHIILKVTAYAKRASPWRFLAV